MIAEDGVNFRAESGLLLDLHGSIVSTHVKFMAKDLPRYDNGIMGSYVTAKRDVVYMGKTEKILNEFPSDVYEIVKTNLQALQSSKVNSFGDLPDWSNRGKVSDKPLKGRKLDGTHQLTVRDRDSYRVIYVATYDDCIFVLHCFKKKTEGKSSKDMKTVEQRYARLKKDRESGAI